MLPVCSLDLSVFVWDNVLSFWSCDLGTVLPTNLYLKHHYNGIGFKPNGI